MVISVIQVWEKLLKVVHRGA